MDNAVAGIVINRLREDLEDKIIDSLTEIVNPSGVVGFVIGETEGVFGCEGWERFSASRLAAISATIAVKKGNVREGDAFYKKVLEYVALNVGRVSETQLAIADKVASSVSHCQEGAAGRESLYSQLKKDGFFDRLKPVYATLEILTSMLMDYGERLPTASIKVLKEYLTIQESGRVQEVSAGDRTSRKYRLNLKKRRYKLNRYQALLENCEGSYKAALELLSNLDVKAIRQTIIDQKVNYRNPL